jgi:hypothetical protein
VGLVYCKSLVVETFDLLPARRTQVSPFRSSGRNGSRASGLPASPSADSGVGIDAFAVGMSHIG